MVALRWYCLLSLVSGLARPAQAQQLGAQPPDYRFSQAILAQWQHDSVWSNYQNYAVQFSQIGDYRRTLAAQSAFEKGRGGWLLLGQPFWPGVSCPALQRYFF